MIDTTVMVAGIIDVHQHHDLARTHVATAMVGTVPGIVLAETWAALRRGPWNLDPATVEQALAPWASTDRIVETPAGSYATVLRAGRSLNLGGNVHDLLIALTCAAHDLPLTTLDRRQAALARTVPGLAVTFLLPDE